MLWRNNFISTFLERDLSVLGVNIPQYKFLAHNQPLSWTKPNYSELGRSFGISDKTVKHYLSILEDTFMIRLLMPCMPISTSARVKSPKLYLRDSGIFHALQSLPTMHALNTSPKAGLFRGRFVIEELASFLSKRDNEVFYYAAHSGVELDVYWQENGLNMGAEIKYMDAPRVTKSMNQAMEDLSLDHLWVIYPGGDSLTRHITVNSLKDLEKIRHSKLA